VIRAEVSQEVWPLARPFEVAREVQTEVPMIHVWLRDEAGHAGQAEAVGIDYDGETPAGMAAEVTALGPQITRAAIDAMPAGGARNALDCAWWDLMAKREGRALCKGLPPIETCYTVGLGTHEAMQEAAALSRAHALVKIKVDSTRHLDAVRWVREVRPEARIVIDANEGWDLPLLEWILPELAALGVEMVEQPLPRGEDAALAGLASPIPLCADESCTTRASLPALLGRYQAINIKLDKTGGLTEALALAEAAKAAGLDLMVGNMCGTSLGMAPAFLVAQQARWADLDGPLLFSRDRAPEMRFEAGCALPPPSELWG
jgi:L-alanine-DL-glutamate epimerase-like enolase superfamily enzyme